MKTIVLSTCSATRPAWGLRALFAASALALAGASAHAQLISSESFAGYTAGTLLPNNIPAPALSGYSGNWTNVDFGTAWAQAISGSLIYTGSGYAAGSGDHIGVLNNTTGGEITAANSGRMYRLLDGSLAVTGSTAGTRYMSWLFQSGQETGASTYQMLDLYNGDTADANRIFTAGLTMNGGNSGSEYDFGVNEAYTSTGVAADTGVHLFVVKFDLSATDASDNVTVWIDPVLGAGEPAGGLTVSAQNIAFDRLAISDYEGNSANWDEIRWGSTFDSVTVTPPPAAAAVTAVANPASATANQNFKVTATVTPGSGTVTNVTIDLSQIGGSAAASLVLSNANVYTNTFTVPVSASVGSKTLTVSAKDTTPLIGSYAISFEVLSTSRVWDGGSSVDSKWSSGANWVGDVAPSSPTESLTFAGTTRLTPDMDGNFSVTGITFDGTAGSFNISSSTGGTLTNAIGGIVNNSANAQVLNVPIVMTAAQTFNAASGNLTLSNTLTGGFALSKAGSGTVTLAGSGLTAIGNMIVTNGLLKVTSGTVRVSATDGNTKVDLGGSVEVAGGTLLITNGSNAWFPIGDTAGTLNTMTISGGALVVSNNWGMEVPRQGSAVLNLNSGSVIVNDLGGVGLIMGDMATAEGGTINLNGGTFTASLIRSFNSANAIRFNGGTLQPTSSRTDWLNDAAALSVEVRNGGAFVDTTGFNVTIAEPLQHSTVGGDNVIDGGLTKLGAGTLTLTGASSYTGPTRVFGGALSYSSALGSSGGDLVISNATYVLDASSSASLSVGNVTVQNGATLTITNYPDTVAISGTGNLTLSGGTTINLNYGTLSANPTAAAISVSGSFSASGANLINITGSGTLTVGQFPLIDYTGAAVPTNGFVLGTLPPGVSAVLTNNAANTSLDLWITVIGNSLSWHGADADNLVPLPNWDINTTANWYDASLNPSVYQQYNGNTIGDKVTFGDNGYNTDGTNAVNLSGRVVPALVTIDAGTPYRLTGSGGIDGTASLVKNNGGTFLIGTSNNFTGGTVINGGTLAIANNSALGAASGAVTLAGGTLQFAANVSNANPVSVSAASTVEVPTGLSDRLSGNVSGTAGLSQIGGGSLTLSGNVAVAGLTKSDNGTLTLGGSNSINGNVTVNAGTVSVIAGSTAIPGGGNPNIMIGSAGTKAVIQVSGTASLTSMSGGKFVRLGTQGGIGILSNGPASLLSFNTFGIGFGNSGANSAGAIYNQGTFTNLSGSYLGNDDNTYGYFRNSGTAYFNDNVHIGHNDVTLANGSTAVIDITGGSTFKASAGSFWLNDQNRAYTGVGANAGLNITGGTLTFLANNAQWNLNNGSNNYASVNVTGSGVIAMLGNAGFGLGRNNQAINRETLTLANGGTLQTAYGFTAATASSPVFTFNNGTYRASAGNADGMIQNGILAYIQSGGATFDTAGFDCKVPAALLAPSGSGVTSITLGGITTGHMGAPVVKIIGDGVGASAIANFDPATGTITGITVTSPGSGYTTATVTLEGGSGTPGNGATAGGATATAVLGAVSSGGLTKTGNGTLMLNGVNTYTGLTLVSAGTLAGNGVIAGALTNNATLAPGTNSVGKLTINGNITLNAGSTNVFDVNGTTPTNDVIVAGGTVKYGGVLKIVPSGTFTAGQQFVLFSGAGAANSSNFSSIEGTPGSGMGFAFTNGVLSIVSAGPSGPGTLTNSYSAGVLSLAWPAGQGWRLQVQTNSLSKGLSTNWTYVTDGSVSSTNVTVDASKPAMFFRLVYP